MILSKLKKVILFPPLLMTFIFWLSALILDATSFHNSFLGYPFMFFSAPSLYLMLKLESIFRWIPYGVDFLVQALIQVIIIIPFFLWFKKNKPVSIISFTGLCILSFLLAWGWI